MSKYSDVIQKARKQKGQKSSAGADQSPAPPEEKEQDVNLSIKVPRRLRRHWVAEAKRQDTTVTASIIAALTQKFGEPEAD